MDSGALILFPLFTGLRLVTNGIQGGQQGDTTFLPLPEIPRFRHLLPRCAGLRLHALTEGVGSNLITWNVGFFSGFNRDTELSGGPFNIAPSGISAAGTTRSAENTTDTNWSLDSRLVVIFAHFSGVNGVNTARVSAVLAARLIN